MCISTPKRKVFEFWCKRNEHGVTHLIQTADWSYTVNGKVFWAASLVKAREQIKRFKQGLDADML